MGHDTANSIHQRLRQALVARGTADEAGDEADRRELATLRDESALREWVLRHHARLGFDPVWVLTGVDRSPGHPEPQGDGLSPVYAAGSVDPRTGHWRRHVREHVSLPPTVVRPGRFVVRMESRAMEPRLRLGAYLVVDANQDAVPALLADQDPATVAQGPVFAVDVPGEGLVVRLARRDERLDRLVLTGLAPAGTPFFLSSLSDCRILGRVVWVAQTL